MRVYIAGPMRGLPDWNFDAFDEARRRWTERGHEVFCPAMLSRAMPYNATHDSNRAVLTHIIQLDVSCLYAADAIALLPGWEASRGATVELAMAQFLGLLIFDAVTMAQISPVLVPWSMIGGIR